MPSPAGHQTAVSSSSRSTDFRSVETSTTTTTSSGSTGTKTKSDGMDFDHLHVAPNDVKPKRKETIKSTAVDDKSSSSGPSARSNLISPRQVKALLCPCTGSSKATCEESGQCSKCKGANWISSWKQDKYKIKGSPVDDKSSSSKENGSSSSGPSAQELRASQRLVHEAFDKPIVLPRAKRKNTMASFDDFGKRLDKKASVLYCSMCTSAAVLFVVGLIILYELGFFSPPDDQ